jgi:prevent-host-death family protein
MKTIPHRKLRNHSGEVLRQVESGEQFTITVEGRPVAVLGPVPKRQWIPKEEFLKILRAQAPDPAFFEDVKELGGTLADLSDPSKSR